MKCPDAVNLNREDGEALRTRLAEDALTAADRRVLEQVLQWYFWLLFALQEATFSLKRLWCAGEICGAVPRRDQSCAASA